MNNVQKEENESYESKKENAIVDCMLGMDRGGDQHFTYRLACISVLSVDLECAVISPCIYRFPVFYFWAAGPEAYEKDYGLFGRTPIFLEIL